MSYTPGQPAPWTFERYMRPNGDTRFVVWDADGHTVCSLPTVIENPEEVISGRAKYERAARILAAGPELVEALQELSNWMRSRTGAADGTVEMLTRAMTAIAKATEEK